MYYVYYKRSVHTSHENECNNSSVHYPLVWSCYIFYVESKDDWTGSERNACMSNSSDDRTGSERNACMSNSSSDRTDDRTGSERNACMSNSSDSSHRLLVAKVNTHQGTWKIE